MVLLCHLKPEVIETVRKLIIEDDRLKEYMEIFDKEVSRGLDIETCDQATVNSIITHINKLPTGNEEGKFLGLDFSGPKLKLMLVTLQDRKSTMNQKVYDIPEKYKSGKSERLFDFIAKCLAEFVKGLKLKMLRVPLGVTFGFPIEQRSLQDCILLRWAKGFQCNDLVGENIFTKLKDSIRKFPELKRLYLIGILNDAVNAVISCAWQDPSCMIGVVVGPGFSCCYAEKVYRVTKYETESYAIRDVYMSLESSGFGEDGCLEFILCDYDEQLDNESKNPGKQINEKLISTEYFGELARLALLRCIEKKLILDGVAVKTFQTKNAFTFEHMARIEQDPDDDHQHCREVLTELGYENVTDEDCFQVQFVCRCVSRRSANLVAAQLAAVINRINAPTVTIAADGTLIKDYPNYKWYLVRKLGQLKNEECQFQMIEAEEDGIGPAVLAAVFGEEVMNRDEKLRRLPGFPMDKCHFGKKGKCLNPDCSMAHPCDTSKVNPCQKPETTISQDLFISGCMPKDKKKGGCSTCKGYDKM